MSVQVARSAGRWLGSVLGWTVLLAAVAVLLASVAVPRLAGAQTYTVLTGSMRPGLPPGTLIVVRPTPATDLAIGDVITYQIRSGQPAVVTHRIISVSYAADGGVRFTTQGDNNGAVDDQPVQPGQVRGRLWYALPLLGWPNSWLSGERRLGIVAVVAVALFGYAAVMFGSAARDRRRRATSRAGTAASS